MPNEKKLATKGLSVLLAFCPHQQTEFNLRDLFQRSHERYRTFLKTSKMTDISMIQQRIYYNLIPLKLLIPQLVRMWDFPGVYIINLKRPGNGLR